MNNTYNITSRSTLYGTQEFQPTYPDHQSTGYNFAADTKQVEKNLKG